MDEALWQEIDAGVPSGRAALPEEIARARLFLTSDLAAYVTGNILSLDGGVASVTGLPWIWAAESKIPGLYNFNSAKSGRRFCPANVATRPMQKLK